MNQFIIDGHYACLLQKSGLKLEEILRKADLPEDSFRHKTILMKEEEYFRFIEVADSMIEDPLFAVHIACSDRIEMFAPPIFAAYCSKNGFLCIERLARYKKLIGPMVFQISKSEDHTQIEIKTSDGRNNLPRLLVEIEYAILVQIIRKASGREIQPARVHMREHGSEKELEAYLGVHIDNSEEDSITFHNHDLAQPFITYDEAMWNYFEPELAKRLSELEVDDSVSARVRSALMELLPSGLFGIEDTAQKLGFSKRTLQRKLMEENTSFQKQLNHTRELLAKHYLSNTELTINDIAFLLGYQEINSFLRSFKIWTGIHVSEYKRNGGID